MSKEVRIGILGLLTVALGLWGIKYIQGSNLLSRTDEYYAYFTNVGGVQVGTPVQVSGVNVGSISNIELSEIDRRVRLTLNLERELPLPKDTRAVLVTTGFLGDMAIYLEYDKPCINGVGCAESGDTLQGDTRGMVEAILGEGGIEGYVETLNQGIQQALDSLNQSLLGEDSDSPIAKSARSLESTMTNLEQATSRANLLVARSSPALERALEDLQKITSTLAEQRASIASLLQNADSLSQQLVAARLDEVIKEVKGTVAELSATLNTTNNAMGGVNNLVNQIEAGEGTLGKLVTDEELYRNLRELTSSLDSLLSDIQNRPYRYIPLKGRNQINRYDRRDEDQGE